MEDIKAKAGKSFAKGRQSVKVAHMQNEKPSDVDKMKADLKSQKQRIEELETTIKEYTEKEARLNEERRVDKYDPY